MIASLVSDRLAHFGCRNGTQVFVTEGVVSWGTGHYLKIQKLKITQTITITTTIELQRNITCNYNTIQHHTIHALYGHIMHLARSIRKLPGQV